MKQNKFRKIFYINFILFFWVIGLNSIILAEGTASKIINNPFGTISILKDDPDFVSNINILAIDGEPTVELIENPNRLIIDIPTDKKGKVSTTALNSKNVKSIRIGQHTGKIRVVYDIILNAPEYRHHFDRAKGILNVTIFSKVETSKKEGMSELVRSADSNQVVTHESVPQISASPIIMPSNKPSSTPSSSLIPSVTPSSTPSSILIAKEISPLPIKSQPPTKKRVNTKSSKDKVNAYTFKGGQVEIVEVPRSGNLSTIKAPKPSASIEKSDAKSENEKLIDELLADKSDDFAEASPVSTAEASNEVDKKQAIDQASNSNNVEQAITDLQDKTEQQDDVDTKKIEKNEFDPVDAIENGLNQEMNLKPSFWEWLFAGLAVFFGLVFLFSITYSRNIKKKLKSQETNQSLTRSDYLQEAYQLLNCTESMSDAEIKQKYRQLVKSFHSDQMESKDIPEEVKKLSEEQLKKIHAAYEIVKNTRGS
jgi:DnaJ-domain-containing protein 1